MYLLEKTVWQVSVRISCTYTYLYGFPALCPPPPRMGTVAVGPEAQSEPSLPFIGH
jgi:hypothetical protein